MLAQGLEALRRLPGVKLLLAAEFAEVGEIPGGSGRYCRTVMEEESQGAGHFLSWAESISECARHRIHLHGGMRNQQLGVESKQRLRELTDVGDGIQVAMLFRRTRKVKEFRFAPEVE